MRSDRSPEPTWLLRAAERSDCRALALHVEQPGAQDLHGARPVLVLRLFRLDHHDAGRQMGDAHGRIGRVDVLAAGARGAHRVDADVFGP